VTHLRAIYEWLHAQIEKTGRAPWVAEEVAILLDPETYITRPAEAWERVRTRSSSPRFMAIVKALAEFREEYAQTRNVPRSRVYKDDALVELASTKPTTEAELGKSRLLMREAAETGERATYVLTQLMQPNLELYRPLWEEAMDAGILGRSDVVVAHTALVGAIALVISMRVSIARLSGREMEVATLRDEFLDVLLRHGPQGASPAR